MNKTLARGFKAVALTAVLSGAGHHAVAQNADYLGPATELSGAMHAAAELCGGYSEAQLQQMRQTQRDQAIANGLSGDAFDAAFQKGFDDAKANIAAAGQAEREDACNELRAMNPEMSDAGGE